MSVSLTKAAPAPSVVLLPNPQLGDTEQVNIRSKFMWSMAGTTYSYISTPVAGKFILHFSQILRAKVLELRALILAARATTVTYRDYDGADHTVKILGDPFEDIVDSPAECADTPETREEYHSFVLELEEV
jgi:hypothetical protein